jgi:hypothetical protein
MGATGMLCVSTHDAVTKECVALVSNNTFAEWDLTENIPGHSWDLLNCAGLQVVHLSILGTRMSTVVGSLLRCILYCSGIGS